MKASERGARVNEAMLRLASMTDEMYHRYFREYENDPDLYLPGQTYSAYTYSKETVDRYVQRQKDLGRIPLAILLSGEIVGEIILKNIEERRCATMGIALKNAAWKDRGIGTAAERLAARYVFRELHIPVLYADTIRTNTRSRHVLEKVGFRLMREAGNFKYYKLEETDMDNLIIRLETERDYRAVEELTREAFWNVYKPGADEHYYVHMMRKHPDFIPELAFVLEREGRIIGNIMYTKAWLEDETGYRKEILSFGPLGVAPEFQRQRLGKILIEHSFDAARRMGYDVNINLGNPGNYVSRGFVSCKKKNVSFIVDGNFPTALLVCELVPGALDGRKWLYIPSTAADCCEDADAVAAFDATFPPKEKKWMPSQEEFYIYSHSSVVR